MPKCRPAQSGFETFLTAPALHCSIAATSLNHGGRVPTTELEGAGGCYVGVECGHRSLESREGSLECQGHLWLRQRHPLDDQGKFPSGSLSTDRRLKYTQDAMINQMDYVELGLACADVCTALDRGLNGKRLNDLNNNNPAREAINQLTTWVTLTIHTLNTSLTPTPELWQRSKGISSSRESET